MSAAHTVLVVAAPFFSAPCTTTIPRTSSGNNPPHQGVVTADSQEEGQWRGVSDVRSGGGKWRTVVWSPIFTFWREQVNKGVILEPDMEHNYIELYKTHENTFQIMLTPNQRNQHHTRNNSKHIKLKTIKQSFFLKGFFLIVN